MRQGHILAALLAAAAVHPAAAATVKVGIVNAISDGLIYIADAKGYFAAEGSPSTRSISPRPPTWWRR